MTMNNYEIKSIEVELTKRAKCEIEKSIRDIASEVNNRISLLCETFGLKEDHDFIRKQAVNKINGEHDLKQFPNFSITFTPEQERRLQNMAVDKFLHDFKQVQSKPEINQLWAQQIRIGGQK